MLTRQVLISSDVGANLTNIYSHEARVEAFNVSNIGFKTTELENKQNK